MDLARARLYPAVSGSVEEVAAIGPQIVVASSFLAVVVGGFVIAKYVI